MKDIVVFLGLKMFNSDNFYMFSPSRNPQVTYAFCRKTTIGNEPFLIRKSFKFFNGIVVNRALPSLNGGSLEITLTVPLVG